MKHLSHYVRPGARKVETDGTFTDLLAFVNQDKSIVIALANEGLDSRTVSIRIGNRVYQPLLPPQSVSTIFIN